jgi:hypothetical protein
MRFVWLALGLALAGCNGDGMMNGDGSMSDGGGSVDMVFAPASHLPFPQVTAHTAPVFAAPQVVTITYSDFAFRNQVEQLGDFIVGSQWLDAVGKEYGVGHGTHLQKVQLAATAPATTTDANIIAFLKMQAMTNVIPAPSATNNQLVYLMYFPPMTKIDDGTGSILCQQGYSGYHASDTLNGVAFAYAVLPACGGVLDDLTSTVAHELIEVATDPVDAYYLDVPLTDHWAGMNGEEVADLCQDLPNVTEGGFALQRSWSNAAALAGASPCVPIPAGEIFNDVTPSPTSTVTLAAGMSTTFTLTGWSSAPTDDWSLASSVADSADFDPMATITGGAVMNNGTTATVTLTVPAGTPSGQVGSALIFTGLTSGNFWPVTVIAQ